MAKFEFTARLNTNAEHEIDDEELEGLSEEEIER